ncbi:hypothetical protein [Actinoplanes sp. N902-109]|uniref:hypothetical protein n=1 Tax=Actinoplanes sp. (strain N902-109) TaxID=649831 RepID=UPI00032935DA|nr:hypothetical protein [Actinoplanes sp. N902-109]AGL15700.1 hypothetical protein L083_2190 [Actinoplanes sp. N902-109]
MRSGRNEPWPEQWAIRTWVRVEVTRHRLAIATADQRLSGARAASAAAVGGFLDAARQAARRSRHHRTPWDRWRGASVERAYQNLHAAEVFMVDLLSDRQVEAIVPRVLARAEPLIGRDDPRREVFRQLQNPPEQAPDRTAVQQAMRIAYEASDQAHVRIRDFRNILLVSGFWIFVLVAAMVGLVAWHPGSMPFCFHPDATRSACPSGDGLAPGTNDVLIVAGLGVLGGALAAALAVRKVRGTATPYGVPMALACLKVPTGALTALAGLLLLGGDFVPGLSELDSQRQILAYALVFGYAQQLATRLIDDRAQRVLNSVPSKEAEARQCRPAPAPLPSPGPTPAARPQPRRRINRWRR